MAFHVIHNRKLPVHMMHYEQYEQDWSRTVEQLFHFLGLSPASGVEPLKFIAGKHYRHYFESQHIDMIRNLVKTLASPETWQIVEQYFGS